MRSATATDKQLRRTDTVNLQRAPVVSRPRRIVVGALGALVGLAGIEHGLGEILQGSTRPDGVVIKSWPDASAMEILQGEPAMTIVPNLLVTGILAIMVALAFATWAIAFADRAYSGSALTLLSVALLLVGGGFATPLLGLVVAWGAARVASRRRPGRLSRALASAWPWLLGAAVVGYLGLLPGTVLLSELASFESAALTAVLAGIAFAGAVLAVRAARVNEERFSEGALSG